jgi:hypothetical protein
MNWRNAVKDRERTRELSTILANERKLERSDIEKDREIEYLRAELDKFQHSEQEEVKLENTRPVLADDGREEVFGAVLVKELDRANATIECVLEHIRGSAEEVRGVKCGALQLQLLDPQSKQIIVAMATLQHMKGDLKRLQGRKETETGSTRPNVTFSNTWTENCFNVCLSRLEHGDWDQEKPAWMPCWIERQRGHLSTANNSIEQYKKDYPRRYDILMSLPGFFISNPPCL